uniref:BTB domain-containing protein n=1 Tax=Denticeps clupeoides TaxID=299321 RepID=A0AAY4AFJ8_9TELE
MSLPTPECTPKCRSLRHADEVVAALTRGTEGQLRAFLSAHCCNAGKLRDAFGRTALHLAASLGKRVLLEWLLESKGADLLAKDGESGWTALHRSAFYGQIHCLMALVKHGGVLSIQDKEGLSVLDLTMKDRPAHVVFRNTDPTEAYTWGNNANFSLGHGNQETRHHPELVDIFSRSGVYIKQVVLCKFHSVFLSQKGRVFTCGHGQGGRLGHGDEQTYLVPRVVEGLQSHHCSQVAAARDHTVVLTEEGYVYTFGLNHAHQLGLVPPPTASHVPKQVTCKSLKGRLVIGVAAGRFHTVLWTREAVYTLGLNGGQLGHLLDPNGEKCVTVPRQVSALHHKDVSIATAAASNGATVCVTEKGDVYLLADYQCKKLASKQLNIKKVLVSGGALDHRVDPQVLNENGGEKVTIVVLDEAGRVFCWRSVGCLVRQCRWAYGRQVFMSDVALSKSNVMFVTQEGEGFGGQWLGEYKKILDKKVTEHLHTAVCGHSEAGGVYERIRLEKLPHVHRAVRITVDSKGRNYAVLQSDPKTSLYEVPSISPSTFSQHLGALLSEADEMDGIHDVTLQAGDRTFPAHKYILSMRSEFFRKLLLCERDQGKGEDEAEDGEVRRSEDAVGCDLLVLEKVPEELLEQLLQFIYTDSCEALVHGAQPRFPRTSQHHGRGHKEQEQLIHSLHELGLGDTLRGRSALEVYRSLPASDRGERDKPRSKNTKLGKKVKASNAGDGGANPVKMLQAVARKLGVGSLAARLDGVKYENGKISVTNKKMGNRPRFNQKKCSYLCDVTLRSEDGKEFPCHKCVLCARLEYFNSMLGNPWIEATSCSALDMPTTAEILHVILEYVYTDESPTVKESQNVEFVCNVLVVADQLLITRLKEMCEVAITENLTLKNAAELLEFASMYNAEQLKLSCLQFIVLNMGALLESRHVVFRLIPAMQRRLITPYPNTPDLSLFEDEVFDSVSANSNKDESLLKKAKMKAKRKPRRRSDSSGGYNLSDIIHSPPPTGKTNSVESLHELMTSDSEGSGVGVGSPRDLQSPTPPKGLHLKNASLAPPNRSTPEPIPTIKSSGSNTPPLPPILDLRAIMEMEANSLNLGATPKSPGFKTSPLPTKLSQKQRKMIAMATKEGTTEGNVVKSPPEMTPPKTIKAWATPLHSSPSSRSFRDLLVEEEKRGKTSPAVAVSSHLIKEGCNRRVPWLNFVSFSPVLYRPWVLGGMGGPSAGGLVAFASIVEEEKQQEAALIRSREKPLSLIQIEERAIQDLLLQYKAFNNPDELITVERSLQGPIAAPTWNKH